MATNFLVLLTIQEFLRKFLNFPFLKYIDEFILLVIIILLSTRIKKIYSLQKEILLFLFFYLGFIFAGVLSGFLNKSNFLAIILQILLDLKFLIIFLFFYFYYFKIAKSQKIFIEQKKIKFILNFIILFSLILVIWHFFYPESYNHIFKYGGHFGKFWFYIPRAAGIFWFTGTLASFSAMLLGILLLNKQKQLLIIVILFALLVVTFSRQEFFSFWISLILTKLFFRKNISFGIKTLISIFLLILSSIFLLCGFHYLTYYLLPEFHIFNLQDIYFLQHPRIVLYIKSFVLAHKFFPLGSGLGSYGSAMSVYFNSKIYHKLGFDQYGWYVKGASVLTDTYWPMIIGETGIVGFLSLLISYIMLLIFFYKLKNLYYEIATRGFFIILYLLFVSPTAPIFNSTIILLIGFILIFLLPFQQNVAYKKLYKHLLYKNKMSIKNL